MKEAANSPRSAQQYGTWSVTFTLGVIAVGAALLFTALFALWKGQRDVITFAAAATVAAATVASSYYASATIRQTAVLQAEAAENSYKAAAQDVEREILAVNAARISASLRIMERWNDPNFYPLLKHWRVERLKLRKDSPIATSERLDADADSRAVVQAVLNRLEEMALAVHNNVVDEKVLRDYSETTVLDTFSICSDWVKHKQKDDPKAWVQLEKLYLRWRP